MKLQYLLTIMSKHILVIEDEPVLRENISELLMMAGYIVVQADGAENGMKIINQQFPDLIICDIMLTGTNGFSLLHLLKKHPETSLIPFIFMTAKSGRDIMRKGMELGADDFLFKPFENIQLLKAVEMRLLKLQQNEHNLLAVHDTKTLTTVVRRMLENSSEISRSKNEVLYRPDQIPTGVYYMEKGSIKTYLINRKGKIYTTGIAGVGQFVGYRAIIENRGYDQFAEAMTDCVLKKISLDKFKKEINDPATASVFLNILSNGLTKKNHELLEMAYESVSYRLAVRLLEIFHAHQNEPFEISRVALAEIIGTSTETLVRSIRNFSDQKLIELSGKKIFIPDPQRLKRIIRNY